MRRRLDGGALALLLLAAATPVLAEERSRLEPPDLERYVRWGPLRARPTLELADVGYDDNILARTDDEIGDYTATLTPALEGLLLFGDRAFLELDERLELTGYVDNPDQSFANQLGSARITAPFGSIGAFADLRLDRTKDRPIDLESLRPERAVDGLGVGVVLRPGARTEFEIARRVLGYRHDDPDYEAGGQTIGERLDRREQRTTIAGDYELLGRTRLTLVAGLESIDFDSLDPAGRDKDSRAGSFLPGIDFGEGGPLAGTLQLGWARVKPRDPELPEFSGIVGEAELALRPVPRATIRLGGRSRPSFAIYEDATYALERSLLLGAVYYLVGPFGLEGTLRSGTLTFPGGETAREDRFTRYDVGVRMRVARDDRGRRVEYSLLYRRDRGDSNIDTLDRDRSSIGINAVVGY